MRESKCYISVACFHYGGSDLLRFGKFEVLITSQALLSPKQPIFMQNYNFVKTTFLSRKFVNTRSTKALRDYFALPERPPTSATLLGGQPARDWEPLLLLDAIS